MTLNFGVRMPAWYDLYGLTINAQEDERGIEAAKQYVHGLIDAEVARGIPSERIVLGGFSMGGALALYAGLTYHRPLGCIVSFSGFLLQRNKLPGVSTLFCRNFYSFSIFKTHTANLNVPIFLGHGRNDFLVPIEFGRLTEQALKAFNPKTEFHEYSVEHSTTKQVKLTGSNPESRIIRRFLKFFLRRKRLKKENFLP